MMKLPLFKSRQREMEENQDLKKKKKKTKTKYLKRFVYTLKKPPMYSELWFFFHLCQNNRITKEAQISPIWNNKCNELNED